MILQLETDSHGDRPLWFGLTAIACLLAACGGKTSGAQQSVVDAADRDPGWGTEVDAALPFDPLSSCRDGPCPGTCAPCALCTAHPEAIVMSYSQKPRPECTCDGQPMIDPCIQSSTCDCFCTVLRADLMACPQLVNTACTGAGNKCGPLLVAGTGPFASGDRVDMSWMNFAGEPIYLAGCRSYEIKYSTGVQQALEPCSIEPNAVKVESGAIVRAKPILITESMGTGIFVLSGQYYLGCREGMAIGTASCRKGPITIDGPSFTVVPR